MRSSLALGSLFVAGVIARDDSCKLHSKKYGNYDLRGLRKSGGDWTVEDSQGIDIKLNFCGPVNTQVRAVDHPELVGSYQDGSKGGISLGNFDTDPDMERGVLSFKYTEGSACPKSSARRSTVVQLQCDNSWSSPSLQLVSVVDECNYFFNLKTSYACPTSYSSGILGSLWSLITFLFFGAAAALGAAILYNRFVLKQRGREQIPSADKLHEAFSFVKDMAIISGIWLLDTLQSIFGALKSSRNSWGSSRRANVDYSAWSANETRSGGFQSVPNAPGERDMPAPPGMLGEEDLTEEEDARLVLGDEEEMLGEGGKGKEKGLPQQPQGRFRDEEQ